MGKQNRKERIHGKFEHSVDRINRNDKRICIPTTLASGPDTMHILRTHVSGSYGACEMSEFYLPTTKITRLISVA